MRSNDIYLGMPYDIFSFTMLQEMLALELNVELGSYTHMVGSLHIYEKHFNIFDSLAETEIPTDQSMLSMTKEAVSSEQISLILQTEHVLRKNEAIGDISLVDPYWKQFIEVLRNKSQQEYSLKDGKFI
ncbi:Thymidylate synthase [compost metagenome]